MFFFLLFLQATHLQTVLLLMLRLSYLPLHTFAEISLEISMSGKVPRRRLCILFWPYNFIHVVRGGLTGSKMSGLFHLSHPFLLFRGKKKKKRSMHKYS